LVASPETVRLLQSYSLEINRITFDITLSSTEVAEKKQRLLQLPEGANRSAYERDYNREVLQQFDKVAPVLEKLINDAVPSILAIRQELAIDTDTDLFAQVTTQFALEGKSLLDHMGLELKRRAGILPDPQMTSSKRH
jgi:hypothetical protein